MLLRLAHSRRYSVSGELDYEGNVYEIKTDDSVYEVRPTVDNVMGLNGVQCNRGLETDFTIDRSVFLI